MHVFNLILFVGDGVHSVGLLGTSGGLLELATYAGNGGIDRPFCCLEV